MAQLRAVMRLKRGAVENRNSVVGCAIATYQHVLDGVIADVAVELHRALALGLDTLDSVEQRACPAEASEVIAGFEAAAKAQADAAARADGENLAPAPAHPRNLHRPRRGKARATSTRRLGGASKERAACPVCAQRVAAALAAAPERCMGRSGASTARMNHRHDSARRIAFCGGAASGPSASSGGPSTRSRASRPARNGRAAAREEERRDDPNLRAFRRAGPGTPPG